MTRKGRSITLSLEERDKAQLEAIARELGLMWGDAPNISQLIKAIARRQLTVFPNNDWSRDRIDFLNRARNALVDAEQIEAAMAIAQLLLERSELTLPLRQELEQFTQNPVASWRLQVECYIQQQQPFQLSYQDAAQRICSFTVFHAAITTHEKRQYLDCWCEESEDNKDIPALQHNWCLRLDRITDAAITPIKGQWRSNLAFLEVELHLTSGLAFAYTPKPEDISSEWIIDLPQVKRVVRRISSTFWFIREVLQYGADCQVVSPESVRDRVRQQVRVMVEMYEE